MRYLIAALLIATPAAARLGETPVECAARYGPAVWADPGKRVAIFHKAGFEIGAMFHEGKCEALQFCKLEKNAIDVALPMSDAEIETILTSNAQGHTWKKKTVISINRIWARSDSDAQADYITTQNKLFVATRAASERANADAAAKDKANLKDF